MKYWYFEHWLSSNKIAQRFKSHRAPSFPPPQSPRQKVIAIPSSWSLSRHWEAGIRWSVSCQSFLRWCPLPQRNHNPFSRNSPRGFGTVSSVTVPPVMVLIAGVVFMGTDHFDFLEVLLQVFDQALEEYFGGADPLHGVVLPLGLEFVPCGGGVAVASSLDCKDPFV